MTYYGWVLLKFIFGFLIIITHLNLSGKTQLSQMTPVDFIGNFVLGGIIGGVIYSDAIPFHQYMLVLFIGVGLISLLNWVIKHVGFLRSVAIGDPLPIIKKGRFLMDNIQRKRNRIDILSITSQLHSQGIHSFQDVIYAQIEPGGQLTAICEGTEMPSVIVMKEGAIRSNALEDIERDEAWLQGELERCSLEAKQIFIAEFWDGRLTFVLDDGSVVR